MVGNDYVFCDVHSNILEMKKRLGKERQVERAYCMSTKTA